MSLLTYQKLTYQEDVGYGIQNDQDGLAVLGREQVEQGLQHVGLDQVNHLLHRSPAGVVGDSPHRLLLGLIVCLVEERDTRQGQRDSKDSSLYLCHYSVYDSTVIEAISTRVVHFLHDWLIIPDDPVGHDTNRVTRRDQPMKSHPVKYIQIVGALINGTAHANTAFWPLEAPHHYGQGSLHV